MNAGVYRFLKTGVPSHCFLVLFGVLAIFFRNHGSVFAAGAGTALILAFISPGSLTRLLTWPPILMLTALFATVPWILGATRAAFLTTGAIAIKALILLAVCDSFSSAVSVRELTNLFSMLGFPQFGFVFGIAFNSLPVVERSFNNAWVSLKLKGGIRGNFFRAVRYLALNLIVNLIKYSEDVTAAAKIKRFDPSARRRVHIAFTAADAAVGIYLIFLFACSAKWGKSFIG